MIGVYEIVHLPSRRAYIGSSDDVERRFAAHRTMLKCGQHTNRALQRAWDRDGANAFAFMLASRCSKAELREREAVLLAQRPVGLRFNTSTVVRKGARAPNAGLSDADVRKLYARAARGESICELAQAFHIRIWTARRIVAGVTYPDLTKGIRARPRLHARGAAIATGKLTERDVRAILKRLSRGDVAPHIARDYEVTPRTVYLIRDRKVWRHLHASSELESSS